MRIALLYEAGGFVGGMGFRWLLEVIAYFDQLGFLIITPLMPVILWLIRGHDFHGELDGIVFYAPHATSVI